MLVSSLGCLGVWKILKRGSGRWGSGAHGCKEQQQNTPSFPQENGFPCCQVYCHKRWWWWGAGGNRGPGGGRVGGDTRAVPTRGADGNDTHPLLGPGDEDAPPDPRLLLPGASGRPRSAKPPQRARVRVRASARLEPPDPSRATAAPAHIPRRRGPGLSLRRGTSSKSGPHSRAAEAAARTPERAVLLPSSQRPGRPLAAGAAAPLGSSASTSCTHTTQLRQLGSPAPPSSPPSPGPPGVFRTAGDTRIQGLRSGSRLAAD